MKNKTLFIFMFLANLTFAQYTKITDYHLGELYEKVKDIEYQEFKNQCSGYVGNIKFDYVIAYFNEDSYNHNTLNGQFNSRRSKQEYETYVDKIVKLGKQVDNYSDSYDKCPRKKFNYFKNLITFYEISSEYYVKIDNNWTDYNIELRDFNQKYTKDSLEIVQSKQNEINTKVSNLKSEIKVIYEKIGLEKINTQLVTESDNNQKAYKERISLLEIEREKKIKNLPTKDFSKNKSLINKNINERIKNLYEKYENSKTEINIKYENTISSLSNKYLPEIKTKENEIKILQDYDFASIIPLKPDFDKSKFVRVDEELRKDLDNVKTKINEDFTKLYEDGTNNKSDKKNNNKESTGSKILKTGAGILGEILRKQ